MWGVCSPASTPPAEIAARLSGDEFAVLVRGDHEDTAAVAYAAWQAIGAAPIAWDSGQISVRASVGYAQANLHTPRQLLADADEAMYRAKRSQTGVCAHQPLTPPSGRRSRDRHYR
ncbi:diguanylate cyclase [Micromonospora sp. 4G55]|uniref:GGDEF domain-containing protein n=1 Tax=Micromonospora sp. 4G55 TaxID=2806102 RepID=UPI002107C1EA|nr:diguanylate cyclase [Micromonospora sp. 4G55]